MSKLKKIISAVTAAALLCSAVAFRLPEKIAAAAAGDEPGIESPTDVSEPAEPVTEDSEPGEPVTEDSEPGEPVTEDSELGEPVTEDSEPTEPVTEDSEPSEPVTENPEPSEPAEENPDNQIMTYAVSEGHANHNICGELGCSHDHEEVTDWEAINNYSELQNKIYGTNSGHFYLANDITVDSSGSATYSAVQIGGNPDNPRNIVLCLNGHSISIGSGVTKRIFLITDNATFTICDCNGSGAGNGKLTGGNIGSSEPNGGAVYIQTGTFNMYGGEISGNTSTKYGGAVYMDAGTFNMYGGEISGNTANSGGAVNMQSGTFNMYGGEISGNIAQNYGGVFVYGSNTTFNMYGGKIINNTSALNGGGVTVSTSCTFNMHDGIITGNTAKQGGGVFIGGNDSSLGTFEMHGGTITGNTAQDYGGGVFADGKFEMHDGEISENVANFGSGVYFANGNTYGIFNMSGGTISGNSCPQNSSTNNGGGVCMKGGTFTMSGDAKISNNTTKNGGGGVMVEKGAFVMNGGTISGNKALVAGGVIAGSNATITLNGNVKIDDNYKKDGNGDYSIESNLSVSSTTKLNIGESFSTDSQIGIYGNTYSTGTADILINGITATQWESKSASFTMDNPEQHIFCKEGEVYISNHPNHPICGAECTHSEGHEKITEWIPISEESGFADLTDGGHYYLTGDVTITKAIEITKNITLCLNGHKISQGSPFSTDNKPSVIINNQNGKLVLCDCDTDKNGTITGDSSTGSIVKIDQGVFEMYGGKLSESGSGGNGAGVCISGSSKFNMYGGTISNNIAYEGGGVSTFDTSVFNMYGGTISGNSSRTASSGGVLVSGTSTFNMYGGEITNNTAATYGGGIQVGSTATFNMYGGQITNNTASLRGGGVYHTGTMTIAGKVTITENKVNDAKNNVRLDNNKKLTIKENFSPESLIGISIDKFPSCTAPVDFASGNLSEDIINSFTVDTEGPDITYNAETDTLQLTVPHKWSDWVVTKNPTTTEEGEASRTCSNSNHAAVPETKTLPKVVFTPTGDAEPGEGGGEEAGQWDVEYTPPTMGEPGKYVYTNKDGITIEVEIPALNPADGESIWENSEEGNTPPSIDQPGTYTYTSDEFGEIKVTVPPLNKIDDDGNKIWTKSEEEGKNEDPTPDAQGKYTYTSEEYGEITVDVPALSDDSVWTKKIVKEPTCTKDGECEYTNGVYGTVKGAVPATGHSLKKQDREEPTCTNEGTEEYWYCETCKALFSDEKGENAIEKPVSIPETGHTEETDPAVEATCTEDGKTEGSHCSVCGEVIKAQETVPAKGHTWGEWKVETPATETEKGREVRECSVCHETESKEIPATGATTDPENPDNPDDPTNPDNPDNPDDPTNPDDPDDPTNPDNPDDPTNPDNPDNPDDPTNPDNPDDPTNPDNPDDPTNPDNPDDPTNPDNPDDPTNPDNPDDPTNPDNPDDPTNPDNPDDPEKPGDDNVSTGENAPDTKLETPEDELIKAVLTPEEQKEVEEGAEVKIVLTVEDGAGTVSDEDKAKVEEVISEDPDWKVIQYLDVSLLKTVGGKQERVTKTEEPLRIVFVIPENMRGERRRYAVIRVHEGETAVLFDLDSDPNTVTIETNRFSTYALTYTVIPSGSKPAPGGSGGGFTSPGTGGSDDGGTEPGENGSGDSSGGSSSGDNGTSSGGEASSSGDNGSSSGDNGTSAGGNGSSSGNNGSSSGDNGTPSGGNGTSSGNDGAASGDNGTPDNGASPASNGENGGETPETSASAINIGNIFFGNDNNPATGLAVSMILPAAAALAALIGCARKKK